MTGSIRKRHKIIWLILAVVLPLLLIISVARRHHEPVNENIPKSGRVNEQVK